MTVQKRDELRKNVRAGFNVANFLLILSCAFYIGVRDGEIQEQNEQRKEKERQIENEIYQNRVAIKQQYEEIRTLYVPRTEIEGKLDMMINIMQEMKKDIKENRN